MSCRCRNPLFGGALVSLAVVLGAPAASAQPASGTDGAVGLPGPAEPSPGPTATRAETPVAADAEGNAEPEAPESYDYGLTVTLSTVQLVRVGLEPTIELRLLDQLSLAAFGGIALFDFQIDGRWYTVGGQVRWYAAGDFSQGLSLAAEGAAYDTDELGPELHLSPLIGYKHSTEIGFTFEAQVGPLFVQPSEEEQEFEVDLNINTNFGWSF